MRIAVLLLALLLSACESFHLPGFPGGKADASEPRRRAPQPVARDQAPAAPVEAAQPAPAPPQPSPPPQKRKYEED